MPTIRAERARVRAARHPILGAARVTRFLTGLAKSAPREDAAIEYVTVNGQLPLHIGLEGHDPSLFTLAPDASGDRIGRIFILRNPDKMHNVAIPGR